MSISAQRRNSRHRAYCFTVNNYTNDHKLALADAFDAGIIKYCVYQPEVAPTTGTRHLQGYCVFSNPRTEPGVRGSFPGFHISIARGTFEQNYAYCTKDESRDHDAGFGVTELGSGDGCRGNGHGSGARTDLADVARCLRDGATISQVAQDYPSAYIRYTRGVLSFAQLCVHKRAHKTHVHWFWGPTGTGKTRAASEESPDAYWKSSAHQWWDGYDGVSDIIIDDYRPSFCQFNELLRLLDRYPYQGQIKGGTVQICAKHIYITCPKPPRDMWASRTEEDIAQLERRIEEVKCFPSVVDFQS